MAYRTYKWMDKNGRSPIYHTGIKDYAGSPDLSTDMTLYAFTKILAEYEKVQGKLPKNVAI